MDLEQAPVAAWPQYFPKYFMKIEKHSSFGGISFLFKIGAWEKKFWHNKPKY